MSNAMAKASLQYLLIVVSVACAGSEPVYLSPPPMVQPQAQAIAGGNLITVGGLAMNRLTSDPSHEASPTLSAKDDSLLYVSYDFDGYDRARYAHRLIVGTSAKNGNLRIFYTNTASQSASPAWMPDGLSFVFLSNTMGEWSVVRAVSRAPNSAIRSVLGGSVAPSPAVVRVSPDGQRIVVGLIQNNRKLIATANIDGSNYTQIAEGEKPDFSPDGKRIVFQKNNGYAYQLFVMNAETGADLTQLTNFRGSCDTPRFSPDGQKIVFSSNMGSEKFAQDPAYVSGAIWNLYTIRTDGTELTQLTNGARTTTDPFWGNDGWIYFTSNESGNFDIWRLRIGR